MDLTPWMARWQMLPEKGGVILCAVSGGRDSICLLDYLHTLGQERGFTAAAGHLNHLMRPTAQRDEDFVRSFCARRGIPFYTERADVYALCGTWGLTVEETGRRARYEFLQRTAETIGAEKIATAHHQNDLAETVLLQLLRGTGPQGLTGIPPVRGNIVRPLLDTPRRDIERYIAEHELAYVTDETNGDTAYARNRLRLEIWPELEGINPRAAEHIACTADILRRELSHGRVTDSALCERAVLSRLRVMTEEDWRGYDPGGEGLYHRLYQAARSACTVDGLLSAAKTKRYPLARLRRMALAAYLQLPPAPAQVPYIRVLAATAAGRTHLRRLRDAGAPVLTKPADVSSLGADAAALFALEGRCTDLYVLARPDLTQSAPGQDYRTTPVMV